jgi:hypothetical protein
LSVGCGGEAFPLDLQKVEAGGDGGEDEVSGSVGSHLQGADAATGLAGDGFQAYDGAG